MNKKTIDLRGQVIKGWKILEHTYTGKQSAWVCECTCPTNEKTTKTLISSKLRSGKVAVCHCDKKVENGCDVCGDMEHDVTYRKAFHMVLCTKHNNQMKNFGKVLDNNSRTMYDSNEYILYNDYAEIVMYDKQNNEKGRVKIDTDDIELCKKHKWYLSNIKDAYGIGYAVSKQSGDILLLHKLITHTDVNTLIDHINCDKLDCRKSNLRFGDKSKNSQNRRPPQNNTSGFTGVCYNKNRHRWYAQIEINNERIALGSSQSLKEAVLMRILAEIKYFKDFRNPHNENQYIKMFGKDERISNFLK